MSNPSQINLRIQVEGATVTTPQRSEPASGTVWQDSNQARKAKRAELSDTAIVGIDWCAVLFAINTDKVPADQLHLLYLSVVASMTFQIRAISRGGAA